MGIVYSFIYLLTYLFICLFIYLFTYLLFFNFLFKVRTLLVISNQNQPKNVTSYG